MVRTFDEDKPLPGVQTSNAIHVCQYARRNKTREDVADDIASVPYLKINH